MTTTLGLATMVPGQASAGLLGAGTTVQAFYYNGVFAGAEGEVPVGGSSAAPTPLAAPLDYQPGVADISDITVADTTITITNKSSGLPFCFNLMVGTACSDVIDGFDFKFTGENILGAAVNPASAPGFRPVAGTFQGRTHLGLQLTATMRSGSTSLAICRCSMISWLST